eukprot:TRINITY_DN7596_c0_g1_i1.p1 TRINITY_DN7596_c0_g1~~TRINITY_DN7596_c0_g1_i1.p1  ORF type:complete len:326 (+),score=106.53 TRINITY_DN7596_c0_g1_i1:486-1463(+)
MGKIKKMITKFFKPKFYPKSNIFFKNQSINNFRIPIYKLNNNITSNINYLSINKNFYSSKNDDKKGVKSSLDLFDVFEDEIDEPTIKKEEPRKASEEINQSKEIPSETSEKETGMVSDKDIPIHHKEHLPKLVQVKEKDVLQGQKKANLLLQAIVGLDLGTALHIAYQNKRKSASYIIKMLQTGRKMCQRRFGAESDERILVKEGWVTRGPQQKKIRYHARGRFGMGLNRKSSMFIVLRYISPQDDDIFLRRLDESLNKLQIPKNKVNVVMKRGRRSLVNLIAKDCRLTRDDLKTKVKYLVRYFPDYKPIPIARKSILKSARWGK